MQHKIYISSGQLRGKLVHQDGEAILWKRPDPMQFSQKGLLHQSVSWNSRIPLEGIFRIYPDALFISSLDFVLLQSIGLTPKNVRTRLLPESESTV